MRGRICSVSCKRHSNLPVVKTLPTLEACTSSVAGGSRFHPWHTGTAPQQVSCNNGSCDTWAVQPDESLVLLARSCCTGSSSSHLDCCTNTWHERLPHSHCVAHPPGAPEALIQLFGFLLEYRLSRPRPSVLYTQIRSVIFDTGCRWCTRWWALCVARSSFRSGVT